jgi:hypothetical protein
MSLSVWFWLFYVLSIVFAIWREYEPGKAYAWYRGSWYVFVYILLGLLGWKVFGSPIQS